MAIEGVTSNLPDPRYIKALEDKLSELQSSLSLLTQQVQGVSKR